MDEMMEEIITVDGQQEDEPAEELSPEQRAELVERLSAAKTQEFIARQGEIVTESVRDVKQRFSQPAANSIQRKKYACTRYGKDFGLSGMAANYCVAIQFDAMNKANAQIGQDLRSVLKKEMPETDELTNPLFIKTKDNYNFGNPVCSRDSVRYEETRSCPDTIRKYASGGFVDNAACKNNITVSSYVNARGQVICDSQGNPKLKDGDLLFVKIGTANNTASGLHCIRANVSETGRVTYTAGNNERIGGGMSYYLNKPVSVFHTSDYAKKCFAHHFKKLNDNELLQLDNQLNAEQEQQLEETALPQQSSEISETRQEPEQQSEMDRLSASMSAGHSSISDRIAAFRQRREVESLQRTDLVAGMRADNARLQQKREELASLRGEKADVCQEPQFGTRHYQCEDVAATIAEREEVKTVPQQKQQSGLRRFMNMFSRSEYA